ncbi:MAG TPA: winged helix-turn-helix domain-containing protein, partial [Acidimicrobiia bacterium]|nr:winged helix-turn-helix domain-containing protein [Acidimicrobiia bacterium]
RRSEGRTAGWGSATVGPSDWELPITNLADMARAKTTHQGTKRRVATPAEIRALSHPDRLRIIRLTYDAELTNKELAERLGRDPASTLHHVRTLVGTGFIAPQEPRRGARGAKEIPYRSTGKSWTLDIGEASDDQALVVIDAFRTELLESPPEDRRWARLALRVSPERRAELEARLFELVEEAASWGPDDEGEPWALFVALHARPDAYRSKRRRPRSRTRKATARKAAS